MTDDDDLRSRLRRTDPAAGLAPVAPARTAQLLEKTMTTAAVKPRLDTRLILVAAAALLLIVAVGGWQLLRPPGSGHNAAGPVAVPSAGVTKKLTGPPAAQAKCIAPTATKLREYADFAFAGTVTSLYGDAVALKVTRVYRGAPADAVEVAQEGGSSETMMGSGKFEIGRDYLVASSEGGILVCGYSGEADATGLQELYDEAF
ncbi:hypothetical protein KOI35_15945 [Actinoplanes bogorensis]|uniref:DUF4367 domain-containing protein n=1 Tax=Paractinoplanes bogorensis TaxID=1610840 RepID=A0ABS5YNV2_9ACTN|nr:hypothetical protein [Actinoplanes bogorensis]MBU2664996.1 hypothetical protein [Actinoplanes bogorensis]